MHKKGSFKTIQDGSKRRHFFQDHCKTGLITLTLNTWYLPMRATLVISDPRVEEENAASHRTAVQWSTPLQDHDSTPIYVEPGSVTIQQYLGTSRHLFPNSFDCIGDMQGEYDIKTDPTVPPVQHGRQKVPIEYQEEIEKELAEMVHQRIITKQTEPTPWVSSLTYPKEGKRQAENMP